MEAINAGDQLTVNTPAGSDQIPAQKTLDLVLHHYHAGDVS